MSARDDPPPTYSKTDAIILRTYDYSETSLVLSMLAREHGRVQALAKGARRPKSTFEGQIDLLAEGQAVLLMRPATGLHLLTEFYCRERHLPLRGSLDRACAAGYAADAAGAASPEGTPQHEIHDLLSQTLSALESADVLAVLPFFQLQLLRHSGYLPNLESCAACGARIDAGDARYSFARRGLTCPDCRDEGPHAVDVSRAAIALILGLARSGPAALGRTHVAPPLASEAILFLARLIAASFEHETRALRSLLSVLRKRRR